MHGLAMTLGSDWSLAGSIMTFAIPVGGFLIAAAVLYWLYTRPHAVPGHRELAPAGAGAARASGAPAAATPAPAAGPAEPAAAEQAAAEDDSAEGTE
ncbi:MAG TPA: hypothetical protein VIX86_10015 [Streptosporangiaceae bacterium]